MIILIITLFYIEPILTLAPPQKKFKKFLENIKKISKESEVPLPLNKENKNTSDLFEYLHTLKNAVILQTNDYFHIIDNKGLFITITPIKALSRLSIRYSHKKKASSIYKHLQNHVKNNGIQKVFFDIKEFSDIFYNTFSQSEANTDTFEQECEKYTATQTLTWHKIRKKLTESVYDPLFKEFVDEVFQPESDLQQNFLLFFQKNDLILKSEYWNYQPPLNSQRKENLLQQMTDLIQDNSLIFSTSLSIFSIQPLILIQQKTHRIHEAFLIINFYPTNNVKIIQIEFFSDEYQKFYLKIQRKMKSVGSVISSKGASRLLLENFYPNTQHFKQSLLDYIANSSPTSFINKRSFASKLNLQKENCQIFVKEVQEQYQNQFSHTPHLPLFHSAHILNQWNSSEQARGFILRNKFIPKASFRSSPLLLKNS